MDDLEKLFEKKYNEPSEARNASGDDIFWETQAWWFRTQKKCSEDMRSFLEYTKIQIDGYVESIKSEDQQKARAERRGSKRRTGKRTPTPPDLRGYDGVELGPVV